MDGTASLRHVRARIRRFSSAAGTARPPMRECITSARREITVAIKQKPNMATKRKYPPTAERVGIFQAAWREIAPEGNFAGMTLAAFETQTALLAQSTQRLQSLAAQTSAEVKARAEADAAAREAMRIVAHAVRGDPAYGEDSALYRAMGFVPLSERQSGLTRKTAEVPAANGAA